VVVLLLHQHLALLPLQQLAAWMMREQTPLAGAALSQQWPVALGVAAWVEAAVGGFKSPRLQQLMTLKALFSSKGIMLDKLDCL